MVQYAAADRTFAALADPTRRAVLERLGQSPATITELAGPAGISLTGMKKHVRVLEQAGLVATTKQGRSRSCELTRRPLDEVDAFVTSYRRMADGRLDRLGDLLQRQDKEQER